MIQSLGARQRKGDQNAQGISCDCADESEAA